MYLPVMFNYAGIFDGGLQSWGNIFYKHLAFLLSHKWEMSIPMQWVGGSVPCHFLCYILLFNEFMGLAPQFDTMLCLLHQWIWWPHNNAQSGAILYISSRQRRFLLGNWLQVRFIRKLRTDFSQQFSCEISIFIMSMEGNPPLGQDKVCSTEKDVPQAQCVRAWREGNHNARAEHPGK